MELYIFIGAAFVGGLLIMWLLMLPKMGRLKKDCKGMQGMLESERLIRETSQKENAFLLQAADASLITTKEKLKQAEGLVRSMDTDILLLQKSNEETESLMQRAEPALHEMKLKLIEANNAIARYKAQNGEK